MVKRTPKVIKDVHLWDEVKKSVKPIVKDPHVVVDVPEMPDIRRVNSRMDVRADSVVAPSHKPKAQTGLSRKQVRKITTGQIAIDGTVDLHGMSRAEAERLLSQRIPEAQRGGAKCLLLITGKGGKRFAQTGDVPMEARARDDFEVHGGVLRSFVPELLSSPPLSHFVASFRPSVQKHGGDGALYVMLRGKVVR